MESKPEQNQILLKVITPRRVIFENLVNIVIVRTTEGNMGIMHGHEPASALLDDGTMRIIMNNKEEVLTVLGGVLTVSDNEVSVLTHLAEHPGKIQETINKFQEERAANKQKEQIANLDMHRAERAIRRALVHKGERHG